MSHEAQTRRMANAGKKTGVRGRSSRLDKRGKPGALGKAFRGYERQERIKTEQFWNNLSHEWFGTNPRSSPYNMGKWNPPTLSPPIKQTAPSLVTKQSQELPKKDMGEREDNIWRMVLEGELTEKEGRALIKEIKN